MPAILPDNWDLVPLGELGVYINGRAFKPSEWENNGLPIVRIQNLTNPDASFNYYSKPVQDRYYIRNGDLVISWSATLGAYIWNRGDAILNQHIFKVEVNEDRIDRMFLKHAVVTALGKLSDQTHGTTMRHVTKGKFENFTVPVPRSIVEQRRIVARIEALLAEVREGKELHELIIRDTERLITAIMEDKFKELPATRHALENILAEGMRNGWSPSSSVNSGKAIVLKLGAVLGFEFNPEAIKYTNEPTDEKAEYWAQVGDVFISRSNTLDLVGCAALYSGDPPHCIYPDLLVRLRFQENLVDSRFVVYWLRSNEIRNYITRNAKGASPTMKKINQQHIKRMPFPIVDLVTQQHFIDYFDHIKKEIGSIKQIQAENIKLLTKMEQTILAQAFQGEL
jgi:type I restriction enzyme, S subunit